MGEILDPVSGLVIGNSSVFIPAAVPTPQDLREALQPMVLSASGWRKIFATSGDEEDKSPGLTSADTWLSAVMAGVFTDSLPMLCKKDMANICVAVGMDSRPTGTAIADAMIRVFLARGLSVRFLFIAAAPEIMAYARCEEDVDAFCYISASHNPVGHNGIKLGLDTGGVLSAETIAPIISHLRKTVADPETVPRIEALLRAPGASLMHDVFQNSLQYKRDALKAYSSFSDMVITAQTKPNDVARDRLVLTNAIEKQGLGIVADLNGSARTLSIDERYFDSLGIKLLLINDRPREIAHRIIPEGSSLDQCRAELERAYKRDPSFLLGYVPDNDGDRGNIVYVDAASSQARALEAQDVFALSCLSELAALVHAEILTYTSGNRLMQKAAIVVNDPTSLRIEEIAAAFGAEVFRAEVGEANVVNLAAQKRAEGYIVRILGEGSNGGNITHPSAVRDPLNTVVALAKLLCVREQGEKPGIFQIWCQKRGINYLDDFTFTDVMTSLPAYLTTSVSEERALFNIKTTEHARLKAAYEKVFLIAWEEKKKILEQRFGIHSWRELNYEGTKEIAGFGPDFRSGQERGGFKILFVDKAGKAVGFLWMRGSGTEPVFRVLADIQGKNAEDEIFLLDWHVSMVAAADAHNQERD